MKLPYRYIAIEGNIGSGKTSLANYLVSFTNGVLLPERFEENPFLEEFYINKENFALRTETYFLNDRINQLKTHFRMAPELTIADFSIYKSLVFSSINLEKEQYYVFKEEFRRAEKSLTRPDLIIFLEANPLASLKQIEKRGREYEQVISEGYLNEIDHAYKKFWSESSGLNILRIPGSHFHFPFKLSQMEEFLGILISTEIKGIMQLTPKMG